MPPIRTTLPLHSGFNILIVNRTLKYLPMLNLLDLTSTFSITPSDRQSFLPSILFAFSWVSHVYESRREPCQSLSWKPSPPSQTYGGLEGIYQKTTASPTTLGSYPLPFGAGRVWYYLRHPEPRNYPMFSISVSEPSLLPPG